MKGPAYSWPPVTVGATALPLPYKLNPRPIASCSFALSSPIFSLSHIAHLGRVVLLVELREACSRVVREAYLNPPFARRHVVVHEHEPRQSHRAEHHEHQDQRKDLPERCKKRKRGAQIEQDHKKRRERPVDKFTICKKT